MVTENVNIVFRESGIRVIKRNLDDLGQAANNATRGIFLLQRALFVLGGAGIIRGLAAQLDLLTSYENRLRLTTTSAKNLQAVQTQLFDIAARSRTSFEGVNEIYNRTALSARQLGRSQQELLRFTESVSKAAVVSGASAREANAALIQLGQGIASNRLGGDELRSILEQLPFVADVIAEYLTNTGKFGKVGRGELRKLGTDGKLTADIILDAFKNSSAQIDAAFAKLTPTIDGAAEVFRTRWLQALDAFDDTFGVSELVARGIILVAENIGVLITVAASAAAVLASMFVGSVITGIFAYINGLKSASIQQTAVLNRLIAIRGATVAKTQADVAANAAEIRSSQIALVRIRQNTTLAQQAVIQAAADVNTQRAIAAQTGSYLALITAKSNLARATSTVIALQAAEAAGASRVAAAQGAAAGAATLATGAQARLGAAQAVQAGLGARLLATFPLLAGAFRLVAAAARGLFSLLFTNPITAIIASVVLAIGWFIAFGNSIKVTADGVVGLRDAAVAAFQLIVEGAQRLAADFVAFLQPAIQFIRDSWATITEAAVAAFNGIVDFVVNIFNTIVGTVVGFVNGTIRAFDILPAAILDIFNMLRNNIIDAMEGTVNAILQAFYDLPENIGRVFESISTFASDAVTFVVDAFRALPGAIASIAAQAAAFLKSKLIGAINTIIAALNTLPGIALNAFADVGEAAGGVDFDLPDLPDFSSYVKDGLVDLQGLKGQISGAAAEAGSIYGEEFTKAYSRDFAGEIGKSVVDSLTPIGDAIIERSRENLKNKAAEDLARQAELNAAGPGSGAGAGTGSGGGKGKGGGGSKDKTFQDIIAGMQQEIELLRLGNKERQIAQELLKIEKDLKRGLTDAERELATATIQNLEASKLQAEILERIVGPREKAIEEMAALNALFDQGRISIQQYNAELLNMGNALNEVAGTFMGSFKAAIGDAILTTSEFGKAVGGQLVGFIDSAADAIVEFAKTGKINLKSLFQELFANLLKLAAQQLLLRFLGGILGLPGGGLGAGLGGGGGKGILGFSTGGSILPSGPGSTDTQMVAFAKRPDERVDVLTPGQQNAQRNGNGGGGGTTIVQSPPVNVAALLSPSDIVGAFDNSDGETLVINILQRNASTVRRITNG